MRFKFGTLSLFVFNHKVLFKVLRKYRTISETVFLVVYDPSMNEL